MELTTEGFTKALVEAVIEWGPDYVYQKGRDGCLYVLPTGKPGCLIGVALHKCGVPLDDLVELEGTNAYDVLQEYGADSDLRMKANRAQHAQDSGSNWGQALIAFLRPLR